MNCFTVNFFMVFTTLFGLSERLGSNEKISPQEAENQKALKEVVAGNTGFAFDLYRKLLTEAQSQNKDENMFFSPCSISTALSMTYAGARGETQKQMAEVLHFTLGQDRLYGAFAKLQGRLDTEDKEKGYQLSIANALWGQEGYDFLPDFLELTQRHYGAGLRKVDFIKEAEKTRQTINAWVEKKTNEKIKNLIPKGVLDSLTRLVLTNAIYFKGDWASKFKEENTKEDIFYTRPDKKIKVPLMHQTEDFKYGETEDLQILELPYKGDELSMLIVLPREKNGLAALEGELNPHNLRDLQEKLRKREVEVYLPKFKMTSEFSLKKILAEMGMPNAFDIPSGTADFSGMNGNRELFISAVLHKAFVEVNEEGTEAAAATAVVMSLRAMPVPPPVFRADHPFLFIIKDNETGSILFMGRMVNPKAES